MNDFKLNSDYDIEMNSSNTGWETIEGQEAIAQNITQRLKTIAGEWFLNTTIHVDLWNTIFEKGTSPEIIESHIKNVISGTPGFIAFQSFLIDIDTRSRQMKITYKAETETGVIEYNNIIGAL